MDVELHRHIRMNTHSPRVPDFAEECEIDAIIREALSLNPQIERFGDAQRITFQIVERR
jgi:hypothetical protein